MSASYGVLTMGDAATPVNTLGQGEVWNVAQAYFDQYIEAMNESSRALVERVTDEYKTTYYLPGGGMAQRRGGQAQSHAVRPYGSWDISLPLEEFGDQIAETRNALAMMTLQKLQSALDTIRMRDRNRRYYEMMRALFTNTSRTYIDPDHGDLTVRPLAITSDGVVYPPLMGTTAESTLESYYESGYAASAISDTNNPVEFMADKLFARFGSTANIVVWAHMDQKTKLRDLPDFDDVADPNIRTGSADRVAVGVPANIVGEIIGRCNGAWVSIWSQIPSGYMLAIDTNQPRPLLERRYPTASGIQQGLHLVTESGDAANYPFNQAHWEDHFGFGVGNRLNGIALELGTAGTYTVPTAFA